MCRLSGVSTGAIDHRLILAAEAERETFQCPRHDLRGLTNQDRNARTRRLPPNGALCQAVTADVAIRRDLFNRFKDATALRASLLGDLGAGFALTTSYSEGIAQPTFFDLYGFFPGNFVGNPSLKPESSRGFEAGVRYHRGGFAASLTGYRQRLHDEIVESATPSPSADDHQSR